MTKDRKDIYERVTERMIDKLEGGTVPWRQPWKSAGADGMPCNANSKRPYNGFNLVVTLFSGYQSPYWATFKGWKKLGGSVRKGAGRISMKCEVDQLDTAKPYCDRRALWSLNGILVCGTHKRELTREGSKLARVRAYRWPPRREMP
jgi:hypothetical protein